MGFKEVASLNADFTVSLGKQASDGKTYNTVEGYFLGSREVTNDHGTSLIHVFKTAKGNWGVWGSRDIDTKLKNVGAGTMTRVTFTGLAPKRPGKSPMKLFKVESDDTNTMEVGLAPQQVNSYAEDNDDDNTYDLDNDDENEDIAYAPAPNLTKVSASATLTPAERKAKVQELLKKKA